jgi:hypothetical protein
MNMITIWKDFKVLPQPPSSARRPPGAGWNHRERIVDMSPEERKSFWQNMKEVLYGMASHDMSRYALRTRASMEHLFILITMGDMIGVPILPPYYSLRLLPYVVPQISTWKRRLLREKDVSDAMF